MAVDGHHEVDPPGGEDDQEPARRDRQQLAQRGVRVTRVPEPLDGAAESGALVVLAVPRALAAGLVGASATARLAVTLC